MQKAITILIKLKHTQLKILQTYTIITIILIIKKNTYSHTSRAIANTRININIINIATN